jgi:hypothetical protein
VGAVLQFQILLTPLLNMRCGLRCHSDICFRSGFIGQIENLLCPMDSLYICGLLTGSQHCAILLILSASCIVFFLLVVTNLIYEYARVFSFYFDPLRHAAELPGRRSLWYASTNHLVVPFTRSTVFTHSFPVA